MKFTTWKKRERYNDQEIADLLGISIHAVRKFTRGSRIPRREIMDKIFELTGGAVTANDFYGQPSVGVASLECEERG